MKKMIMLCVSILAFLVASAQNSKISEAREYINKKQHKEAIVILDEAILKEDTKNNAEVWYLRGMAYLHKAADINAKDPAAQPESYSSLMKALSLKPDYKEDINYGLYANAMLIFNEATMAFNNNPAYAYDTYMKVLDIYNTGNGKRFAQDKDFANLARTAKINAATSAVSANKNNEALRLLNELKKTTVAEELYAVYNVFAKLLENQHDDTQLLSLLKEAQARFPDSSMFRTLEINYYIKKGETDILIKRLDAAVKAEPQNATHANNLGIVCTQLAFPKDEAGEAKARPQNFSVLFAKGEAAFQSAIKLASSNIDYKYNIGALYLEGANYIVKQMNAIGRKDAAEEKQYTALQVQRDEYYSLALPYFEAIDNILNTRSDNLTNSEKYTYRKVLKTLRIIYGVKGDDAKYIEVKNKLSKVK